MLIVSKLFKKSEKMLVSGHQTRNYPSFECSTLIIV